MTTDFEFEDNIAKWLSQGQYQRVKNVILDRNNIATVKEKGMEIITEVCLHLNDDGTVWSAEMEECCEFSLLMVAQLSNPKEVLLSLQEQVDLFGESSRFKILLLPFQAVLLRLPDKKCNLLNMTLATIGEHVKHLPGPDIFDTLLEGDERLLLDTEPRVQCISDIYEALAEFYTPFLKPVSLRFLQKSPDEDPALNVRRQVLKKNILNIMGEPLASMDLHAGQSGSSSLLRVAAEKLVMHLSYVCGDFFSLCANAAASHSSEDIPVATIFYLIFGEQLHCSSIPQVYTPGFIIHSIQPYANLLLNSFNPLQVHKGLLLTRGIFTRIEDASLSSTLLDHPVHLDTLLALVNIAIKCTEKEFKVMAIDLFRPLLNKFQLDARYIFLRSLLSNVNHAGVKGFLINLIKDNVGVCLNTQSPFFLQDKLSALLPLIWHLPHGVETDLLENMDPIMGALNLARFLLLRDKTNTSGFADHLNMFDADFLQPLAKGLSLSRAHYELELNNLKMGKMMDADGLLRSSSQMSCENQIPVFQMALNSFDLLESVMARVSECIHLYRTPSK